LKIGITIIRAVIEENQSACGVFQISKKKSDFPFAMSYGISFTYIGSEDWPQKVFLCGAYVIFTQPYNFIGASILSLDKVFIGINFTLRWKI